MAFNDDYRESIQSKHAISVGFTTTAKGVTNEGNTLKNPHQVLANQIPAVDVVGTYGALVADGISAGLVEKHTIKLTQDPTVNDNKAWFGTENNCIEPLHADRGELRVDQWMRYGGTQYKLRLFEDNGAGTAPDYTKEILPSEVNFNWEYDASVGVVFFDDDPSSSGKTLPLWGEVYTYVGDTVQDGLGATSSGVSNLVELFDDTNEPTGFVNRTSSTLSFDDATRTLTVSGTEFAFYIEGEKYTKNGAHSVQIADSEGMHYIYYQDATLTASQVWSNYIITRHAFVTAIYWDAVNKEAIYVGDERHGITMDGSTHSYLHSAFGTQYIDGLGLLGIQSNDTGTSNDHARFGFAAGHIRDEDLLHTIYEDDDPAQIPVFYKDGASGVWRELTANDYPIADNHGGATLPKWNEWTGATWQLTEVATNGNMILAHIFATNDANRPMIAVAGQAEYTNVNDAREGANNELNNLILTGLPFAEFVPVGTVIYMCSSTYGNTPKARIITDADNNDYVDWRLSGLSPNPQSVANHANLTGRDSVDSHPAAAISADVTNFNGALSAVDINVQLALDTLDDAVQTNADDLVTASGVLQQEIDDLEADLATVSGSLQDDIIWEIVDTPSNQIRPKVPHQGKALYTAGNLTIGGDLTVSGTTTTVHSAELSVADKVITVNAGEAGAGITGSQYAGIEVDRGSETDYYFVFDEVQDNFQVGISGSLQPVATREDSPENTRVPWWSGSEYMFRTQGTTYMTIVSGAGTITMTAGGNQAFAAGATDVRMYSPNGDSQAVVNDTNAYLSHDEHSLGVESGQVYFAPGGEVNADVTTAGLRLYSGARVNEILDSNETLDISSTDTQLATAKLIFESLGSTALSGTPSYMYYVGNDGNMAETSNMTYDVSTGDVSLGNAANLDLDQVAGSATVNISSTAMLTVDSSGVSLETGTSVNEIVTTVVSGATDDQLVTAKGVYDADAALRSDLDALQNTVDAQNEFIELDDVSVSSYTANNMLYTTASGVTDTDRMTFNHDESLLDISGENYHNSAFKSMAEVDGSAGVFFGATYSGANLWSTSEETTMGFYADNGMELSRGFDITRPEIFTNWFSVFLGSSAGQSTTNDPYVRFGIDQKDVFVVTASGLKLETGGFVDEISTTVDASSTDAQLPTAKSVYDYASSISGTLTDATIWEVVDTPSDQIRPKIEHQGKAIYSAGNLTIGGDLTVSGTTTTVHSQELTVADKVVTVNAGEVGAGITGSQYAGIEVDRGSETDYMFVFDEVQDNFRVGISGSLQAVATREDNPLDTRVPYWNSSAVRFDTSGDTYQTITTASGSQSIDMFVDNTRVLELDAVNQTLGGAAGDTRIRLTQGSDTIAFYSGADLPMTLGPNGMQLDSGTNVNNISTTVDMTATNNDLATSLAIYTYVEDRVTTATGTLTQDHNEMENLQGGNGVDEYYHMSSNEYNAFSSDGTTWTFSQDMALATGGSVDEIVTTVTSGTTDSQLPTAKAVWDLTEAAASAVHVHYEQDAVHSSDTLWTYNGGFTAVPDGLMIFVNGVKQRVGASYDCTVAINGTTLEITFTYSVRTSDWVSINYYA